MATATAAEKREAVEMLRALLDNEPDLGGQGMILGSIDQVESGALKVDAAYLERLRARVAEIPEATETIGAVLTRRTRGSQKRAAESLATFDEKLEAGSAAGAAEALREARREVEAMEAMLVGRLT
jgi:hypothetical protein